MITRTVKCSVEGCDAVHEEAYPNEGFPNWGHLKGLQATTIINKKEILVDTFFLCPFCLAKFGQVIRGDAIVKDIRYGNMD